LGTWGTAIKSNDTSADIYANFFDLYNEGKEPTEIKNKLILENPDGENDFWFALALALWETKSLPKDILEKIREIIQSKSDLKLWKELDASESDIKKRKIVLDKFLIRLESEKTKPKARKKNVIKEPIFESGTCLLFELENGNYGGALVLATDSWTKFGYHLIVTTRINQKEKPTLSEFKKGEVLIANFGDWDNHPQITWCSRSKFKKEFSQLFEVLGNIPVEKEYDPVVNQLRAGFSANWKHVISPVVKQFEYEQVHGLKKSFPLKNLTMERKWWQFW
jgi:hypothetical protein